MKHTGDEKSVSTGRLFQIVTTRSLKRTNSAAIECCLYIIIIIVSSSLSECWYAIFLQVLSVPVLSQSLNFIIVFVLHPLFNVICQCSSGSASSSLPIIINISKWPVPALESWSPSARVWVWGPSPENF